MCSVEYCCLPTATLVSGTLQVSVEPEGAILVVGTLQVSIEHEGAILVTGTVQVSVEQEGAQSEEQIERWTRTVENEVTATDISPLQRAIVVTDTLQGFCASVEPEAARSEKSTELEWKWTRKVENELTYTDTSPLQHDSMAIPVTGTIQAARSEKLNEFEEQNKTRGVGNEVTPTSTCTSPLHLTPPYDFFSLVNVDSQTYSLPPSVEQTHVTRPLRFDTSSSADNSGIGLLLESNKTNKELREEFLGFHSMQQVVAIEEKAARSELMEQDLGILCTYCLCVCACSVYPISSGYYVN